MYSRGVAHILIIFFVFVGVAAIGIIWMMRAEVDMKMEIADNGGAGANTSQSGDIPGDLGLPFDVEDLNNKQGIVNPLGVVRSDQDEPDIGHNGIDFPLFEGANIYAVADGEVLDIEDEGDPWGGKGISQLLEKNRRR